MLPELLLGQEYHVLKAAQPFWNSSCEFSKCYKEVIFTVRNK